MSVPPPGQSVPPPSAATFLPPVKAPPAGAKSATTAVLLSLLLTGAGHCYTGEVRRGLAFLGGAILATISLVFVVGIVALPAVAIWATIDAGKSAERHNARLAAT